MIAIIDFGDMMIGDPAWDMVNIYEDYGLDFLSRLLLAYREDDRASLLRRVYQFHLLGAVEWAIDCRSSNDADLAEALTQLRVMAVQEEQQRKHLLASCGVA